MGITALGQLLCVVLPESVLAARSNRRFTNEAGFDKNILVDLLQQTPASYWMIFDETARDSVDVRGAALLKNPSADHPILNNPQVAKRAQNLRELAFMAKLPGDALAQTVVCTNCH